MNVTLMVDVNEYNISCQLTCYSYKRARSKRTLINNKDVFLQFLNFCALSNVAFKTWAPLNHSFLYSSLFVIDEKTLTIVAKLFRCKPRNFMTNFRKFSSTYTHTHTLTHLIIAQGRRFSSVDRATDYYYSIVLTFFCIFI